MLLFRAQGQEDIAHAKAHWSKGTLASLYQIASTLDQDGRANASAADSAWLFDSLYTGDLAVQRMDNKSIKDFFTSIGSQKHSLLSAKAYYNLGILFARMKNYPVALRYFAKSGAMSASPDISDKKYHFNSDTAFLDLPLPTMLYDSTDRKEMLVYYSDTLEVHNRIKKSGIKSKPISRRAIMAPFRENKAEAKAYGILIHVKQPSYGKRKQFEFFNNVGHMFISLIQYLPDNKSIARTFGFYPNKDNFLSATPIFPGTSSTFKDDELHDWDESVGKFITYKQFSTILKMVSQYSRKKYHLNKNNCTDFGLVVAAIAGIDITDTKGTWPLGSGNDPGDTGQSIIEGKVKSLDGQSDLFIIVNPDSKN